MKLLDYRAASGGHILVGGHRERDGWHIIATLTPPEGSPATVELTAAETLALRAGVMIAVARMIGGKP